MIVFKRIFPLFIFILVVILLWRGLFLHPTDIPSPLLNKPAPRFALPTLLNANEIASHHDFIGHVTLVNIWATWCYACSLEHEFLMQISKSKDYVVYGFNYKDDSQASKKWLLAYGNPYQKIAVDQTGQVAIDWGVYGTPETFIVDKKGIIRYKLIGPITPQNWNNELLPIILKLRHEP